jgi:hypothetical protein
MERAFLSAPQTATQLALTKTRLSAWARSIGISIIDAGQSERFGCTVPEFVDEHHALPACYARIFSRFWSAGGNSTKLPAGLYPAD